MNITFTAPLDRAQVEILFNVPVLSRADAIVSLVLSSISSTAVFAQSSGSITEINSVLMYCGRIFVASPSPSSPLSGLISPTISLELTGVEVGSSVTVEAVAQTSKRELTTLSALQG